MHVVDVIVYILSFKTEVEPADIPAEAEKTGDLHSCMSESF